LTNIVFIDILILPIHFIKKKELKMFQNPNRFYPSLLLSLNFCLSDYLKTLSSLSVDELRAERSLVGSLIHGYNYYNTEGYVANQGYYGLNARTSKKILSKNKDLNSLESLKLLFDVLKETIDLKRHSCHLAKGVKELRFLSIQEVVRELKKNKHAQIVYNDGVYDLVPTEDWGGVTKGLIRAKDMTLLLSKNIIEQGVYFNHKGRKLYVLQSKAKKSGLPVWLKWLPLSQSYLQSCGVR
jgi:hypothetical protein